MATSDGAQAVRASAAAANKAMRFMLSPNVMWSVKANPHNSEGPLLFDPNRDARELGRGEDGNLPHDPFQPAGPAMHLFPPFNEPIEKRFELHQLFVG